MNWVQTNQTQPTGFKFSSEYLKLAKTEIAKYPKGREASAVMALLDLAQRQHDGWLPRAAMDYVASLLNLPPIKVYEVATFYTMYNLNPVGRFHVQVCTNLPCWLRGSDKIMATCEHVLEIQSGQTSEDGQYTLSEVECLGACVNAPMIQINDNYYEDLDPNSTRSVLTELAHGRDVKTGSQIDRISCEPISGLTSLKKADEVFRKK